MPEEIDLDQVNISPAVHNAWQGMARSIADIVRRLGISPDEIPDEKARIEDDGSLTIFVELPIGEVSLRVPPDQWAYRFPKN